MTSAVTAQVAREHEGAEKRVAVDRGKTDLGRCVSITECLGKRARRGRVPAWWARDSKCTGRHWLVVVPSGAVTGVRSGRGGGRGAGRGSCDGNKVDGDMCNGWGSTGQRGAPQESAWRRQCRQWRRGDAKEEEEEH